MKGTTRGRESGTPAARCRQGEGALPAVVGKAQPARALTEAWRTEKTKNLFGGRVWGRCVRAGAWARES